MKFTEVYWFAEKGAGDKGKDKKPKIDVSNAINERRSQVTGTAGNVLKKAQKMISGAPHIQQFLIGGATGWTTGFISNKIGKTAAIVGGGSILLIVGANQAGIININWDKFCKQVEQTGSKLESKVPALKGNVGKYARANTYFVAGFVGGFLLGIAS